jgi:hypothetical protein
LTEAISQLNIIFATSKESEKIAKLTGDIAHLKRELYTTEARPDWFPFKKKAIKEIEEEIAEKQRQLDNLKAEINDQSGKMFKVPPPPPPDDDTDKKFKDEYIDLWRFKKDKYELISESLQAEMDLERQAAEERRRYGAEVAQNEYIDLWRFKKDKYELISESLQTEMDLNRQAAEEAAALEAQKNKMLEDMARERKQKLEQDATMIANTFTDSFYNIIEGTKSVSDAIMDMINSIIKYYLRLGMIKLFKNIASEIAGGGMNTGEPTHIGKGGTTAFGMAGGGYIGEHVVGVGLKTGASYEFGEGGKGEYVVPQEGLGGGSSQGGVVNNYLTIQALDSKSFTEVARRNPGAFIAVFKDMANKGNSGFKNAVQKAMR